MMEAIQQGKWTVAARAVCLSLGIAGIAILISYMGHELAVIISRWRSSGVDETFFKGLGIVQPFTFQSLQILLALICMPVLFRWLPVRSLRPLWCINSIMLGTMLALWLNTDAQNIAQHIVTQKSWPTNLVPPPDFAFLFQSRTAHATLWLLHTALLAPLAENLLYRGMLFKLATPLHWFWVCVLSLTTLILAYSFTGGAEGMLFAVQTGFVYVVLRQLSGSLVYPILCQFSFGSITELAALHTVLGSTTS